ncbi:MAG TPA: hypothetical protein PLK35_02130 [Candidatus Moranbacteria bacterium]|nr:hypothetical protein [Candidatus Moranbacteria bacterium]
MDPRGELERKRGGLPSSICESIESFWADMMPVENYKPEWFSAFIAFWAACGLISEEDMLHSVFVYEQLYQEEFSIN